MNDAIYPCPDALTAVHWEKKKVGLPAGSELPDKLKALHKKHGAVDWKLFDPGWAKACKSAAELEEAFALRDRRYRAALFALKRDANDVASAAQRVAKDKSAGKPVLDAAKSIAEAALRFAEAVDVGAEELKKEFERALGALPKDAKDTQDTKDSKSAQDADDDEPGSALLDPKRLLAQLNMCKRDPARRVNFAFVDGKDDRPAAFALHPRAGARKMFATLQAETGVKAGSYGTAWVEDTVLTLQLDKPLSGLVKKVRAPVRGCGFRVTKVVIWNADGSVLEQEETDDAGEGDSGAVDRSANLEAALGEWQRARGVAAEQLTSLADAIAKFPHPQSDAALILVRAIRANLTTRPETRQAVHDLEEYLQNDPIIGEAQAPNGFGITVELGGPLLAALGRLKAQLPS